MQGAAEEAATIEGCHLWAKAGPSKNLREHCRIDCPRLGDFAQHLASGAGFAEKGTGINLHVTGDGPMKNTPITADGPARQIAQLHMPNQHAIKGPSWEACCKCRLRQ